MTAEIIIMNSRAIALAADSAATVTTGLGGAKVFSSDDKIFALTNSAPVGIMTFENADFMGIPLETIVSEYRRRHGNETYPNLEDYGDRFLAFLKDEMATYVSEDTQNNYIVNLARGLTREISEWIEAELGRLRMDLADEDEEIAQGRWESDGSQMINDIIDEYRNRVDKAEHVDGMAGDVLRRAEELLEAHVDQLLEDLKNLEFTAVETERILQIVHDSLPAMMEEISPQGRGDYAGIVIAGYGENALLPSYIEYHVEGLYQDVVKNRKIHHYEIEDSDDSYIFPFAQGDVINTFLFGMEPSLINQLYSSARETLEGFAEQLMINLDRYSEGERVSILARLDDSIEMGSNSFVEDTMDRAADRHLNEIREVASFMPKEQLAEMAEALVSLTSLRRRVSFDPGTVGGPTDVAVITKGDGFIWIKRKQYFESSLNPEYFARLNERM